MYAHTIILELAYISLRLRGSILIFHNLHLGVDSIIYSLTMRYYLKVDIHGPAVAELRGGLTFVNCVFLFLFINFSAFAFFLKKNTIISKLKEVFNNDIKIILYFNFYLFYYRKN